jgi:hypothetical protein
MYAFNDGNILIVPFTVPEGEDCDIGGVGIGFDILDDRIS